MFAISNADLLVAASLVCRGVLIAYLIRIAVTDLKIQKIANRDVIAIALAGLCLLAIRALSDGNWISIGIEVVAAVLLFVALFIFWLLGKVGAGDVKLMATVPIITTYSHLFNFSVLLMIFLFIILFFIKFPMMMPETVFKKYIEVIERKGVVPFGVPISAALIVVILMQFFATEGFLLLKLQ